MLKLSIDFDRKQFDSADYFKEKDQEHNQGEEANQ